MKHERSSGVLLILIITHALNDNHYNNRLVVIIYVTVGLPKSQLNFKHVSFHL